MTNHAQLSPERWSQFTLDQQILMIGNEMNRAMKLMGEANCARRQACYERTLQLVDLTVGLRRETSLARELSIWRGVIADLHARQASDPATHLSAFKVLLRMTPVAAQQIPYLEL